MNIALFGATGRTGREVLAQALQAGHSVTALVRNTAMLSEPSGRLRVVRGDVRKAADVAAAVAGADAVVSVLGPASRQDDVLPVAALHITEAMKQHGVRRLIAVSVAGVTDPYDPPSRSRAVIRGLIRILTPELFRNAHAHARTIQESGLDWTLIRVPRLTEGPRTGAYRSGYISVGPGGQISRGDLADFILKELAQPQFIQRSPIISR